MCQDVSLMFCSFVVQFEKSRCRIALRLFQALSDGVIFFLSFFLSRRGRGQGGLFGNERLSEIVNSMCTMTLHSALDYMDNYCRQLD